MVGPGNELPSLISALFIIKVVTVCFLNSSGVNSANLIITDRILKVNSAIKKKQLSFSDCHHSHGMYDVLLGLYPYLRNGGQSRLEIKMEFYEGTVPFSALPALYWTHLACSQMLVRCVSYLLMLIFFVGYILSETECQRIYHVDGGL